MEFKVKFMSGRGYAVNLSSEPIGLKFLDMVREELGVPNLYPSVIDEVMNDLRDDPLIKIDEDTARLSGHFEDNNYLKVSVPDAFLNKYASLSFRTERDDTDGKIVRITPVWKLHKSSVIKAWAEAGFPTSWGFEDEEGADRDSNND